MAVIALSDVENKRVSGVALDFSKGDAVKRGRFLEELMVLAELGLEVIVVLSADQTLVFCVYLLHVGHAVLLLSQSLRRTRCSLFHQYKVQSLQIFFQAVLDLLGILVPDPLLSFLSILPDLFNKIDRAYIEDMRNLVLLIGFIVHFLGIHVLMVKLVLCVELEGFVGFVVVGVELDVDVFGEDAVEFEVDECRVDGR